MTSFETNITVTREVVNSTRGRRFRRRRKREFRIPDTPDLPSEFPELKTHGLVTPNPSAATAGHTPAPTRAREPGSREDRYVRKGTIGSGGMAEVYLAHDQELDRDVALKVLSKQYTDDEQFIERFKREARNAASLSHPNIVAVYDRGETEEGSYYIVMEYLSGGTLKDRIQKEGALSAPEAVELTLQIAKALEAAHRRGVVHRDVKPQNILLTEEGEAKVGDFGIARAASSSTMTKTGAVLGTAHYISPEQALGQPATPQSDLYSLGIVMYEMLTGEVPHDAETPVGIVMKHVSGLLRPPKEVNPDVPEEINAITMRLLARDLKDRYQNAAELIEDLERVRQGQSPGFVAAASPVGAPPSVRPEGSPGGQPRKQEQPGGPPTAPPSPYPGDRRRRRVLPWVLAASGLVGVAAIVGIRLLF